MASKSDRIYYENFNAAAELICSAANYLVDCLSSYKPEEINHMLEKMHGFEHDADGKKHEMSAALAKAFVTPLDREDLAELSQNIDEVADKVEEIIQRFYVDEIRTVTEDCITFAKHIASCCELMKALLYELPNFKKPEKLHGLIVELGTAEEICDKLYLEATLRIRREGRELGEIIAWRKIYDRMEECADACEHVADSVETMLMKNT